MTIQVFVSYRRGDSPHAAGRLVDRLNEHFTLFMDVDRIRAGADFTAVVREAVDQTDVLVAVIGSHWLTLMAEHGGRRIDQPDDWVAEEIGTALRRATPVIPVLVDGARMPSRDELPPVLADLANRQALRIAHESFAADSARLIQTIESTVSEAKPEAVNLWEDPDYPEAVAAFLQGLWPVAIKGCDRVLHRHPRQTHVIEQLEQARSRQRLLNLDATAKSAAEAGRWQEVVEALEAINALQPSDNVTDRLDEARRKLRITELQNVVRALAANRNWKAVLAAHAELARLDPEAADPDGLASKARAELLEAELAASYAGGVKQLNERDWAGAEATFRALLDRRASYRDAEGLLALARRQGRPEEKHDHPPKPPARKPKPPDPALVRDEVGRQATSNRTASAGPGPPPLVIHQIEDSHGEVGRLATPAAQRRRSRKSRRWTIWLTIAAFLVVGSIATIALVSNGDKSNTAPTPATDYDKLLSHLPASETCNRRTIAWPEVLAEASCSSASTPTHSYRLWKNDASARSSVRSSDMMKGDCLRTPPYPASAYQYWSTHGMAGLLTCHYYDGHYFVDWSVDQLAISASFQGDHYQELVGIALKARDEVK